ncbi:hypothetical protein FLM9_681 [Candidatus Synechococcus spongiarum]|uniref:Uncharacterized protein n=1 Tax=Candidatus Synechococcus spongiarum TaxID=431041 RepID=A0A170T7L2_9SYNE|nr:hypothetical protein FLM9_681 [Candidatus Synechococcus spongiarum]
MIGASRNGYLEIVKALIQAGTDLNSQDKYGKTALMVASSENQLEIVKALIQAGADLKLTT